MAAEFSEARGAFSYLSSGTAQQRAGQQKLNQKEGKDMRKFLTVSLTIVLVFLFSSADFCQGQVIKWRAQSGFARGDFSADLMPTFVKEVAEKSKGRLIISHHYAGDLVPADDTLKGTTQGIIEMSQSCGVLWSDVEPVLGLQFGVPFAFKGTLKEVENMVNTAGLYKLWEEAYARQNCQLLGVHTYGPYPALASNKPIRKIEDFKGLKVRAILSIAGLMKELGAAPGYIPGGEIYMALKLGTYDAATYSIDAIRGFKWHEVIKYYILPYWVDWYFGDIVVNKDAWNKLPDDLKKVLKDAMVNFGNVNKEVYEKELNIVTSQAKQLGYEVITLPDADVAKMRQIAIDKVWPTVAKQNADCAKAVEGFKKYHKVN
jgi:TRAP-type C4-dicarboxylate transport system substrate-binding protein